MTDPRPTLDLGSQETSVMPVVERPRAGLSGWAIAFGALVLALVLFSALEARRHKDTAPSIAMRDIDTPALTAAPPPLYVPPAPEPEPDPGLFPQPAEPEPIIPSMPAQPAPKPIVQTPPPAAPIMPYQPPVSATPARNANSGGAAVVIDNSAPGGGTNSGSGGGGSATSSSPTTVPGFAGATERVRASMLANRPVTVPQGTLISAVLETAFDSTRSGFARAVVSRDVVGFDGSRVLIPRGSRLIGEYQSDISPGQKRALIIWSRLIRPDGATVAIGSPAADTLGRGGVKANVNTHFLERFSGAILQSALNVGVNLATRNPSTSVVVALPSGQGASASIGQLGTPTAIPPTLTVRAGTSISVFVARDLDFSDVEARQ